MCCPGVPHHLWRCSSTPHRAHLGYVKSRWKPWIILVLMFVHTCMVSGDVRINKDLQVVKRRMTQSAMQMAPRISIHKILSTIQQDGSFSDLLYGENGSEGFRHHGRRLSSLVKFYMQELKKREKYLDYTLHNNNKNNENVSKQKSDHVKIVYKAAEEIKRRSQNVMKEENISIKLSSSNKYTGKEIIDQKDIISESVEEKIMPDSHVVLKKIKHEDTSTSTENNEYIQKSIKSEKTTVESIKSERDLLKNNEISDDTLYNNNNDKLAYAKPSINKNEYPNKNIIESSRAGFNSINRVQNLEEEVTQDNKLYNNNPKTNNEIIYFKLMPDEQNRNKKDNQISNNNNNNLEYYIYGSEEDNKIRFRNMHTLFYTPVNNKWDGSTRSKRSIKDSKSIKDSDMIAHNSPESDTSKVDLVDGNTGESVNVEENNESKSGIDLFQGFNNTDYNITDNNDNITDYDRLLEEIDTLSKIIDKNEEYNNISENENNIDYNKTDNNDNITDYDRLLEEIDILSKIIDKSEEYSNNYEKTNTKRTDNKENITDYDRLLEEIDHLSKIIDNSEEYNNIYEKKNSKSATEIPVISYIENSVYSGGTYLNNFVNVIQNATSDLTSMLFPHTYNDETTGTNSSQVLNDDIPTNLTNASYKSIISKDIRESQGKNTHGNKDLNFESSTDNTNSNTGLFFNIKMQDQDDDSFINQADNNVKILDIIEDSDHYTDSLEVNKLVEENKSKLHEISTNTNVPNKGKFTSIPHITTKNNSFRVKDQSMNSDFKSDEENKTQINKDKSNTNFNQNSSRNPPKSILLDNINDDESGSDMTAIKYISSQDFDSYNKDDRNHEETHEIKSITDDLHGTMRIIKSTKKNIASLVDTGKVKGIHDEDYHKDSKINDNTNIDKKNLDSLSIELKSIKYLGEKMHKNEVYPTISNSAVDRYHNTIERLKNPSAFSDPERANKDINKPTKNYNKTHLKNIRQDTSNSNSLNHSFISQTTKYSKSKEGTNNFTTEVTDIKAIHIPDLRHKFVKGTSVTLEDLMELIKASFEFLTYLAPDNLDKNWWGPTIGTPSTLWPAVVLVGDILHPQIINDFLNRYWQNLTRGPVWNPNAKDGSMAGGNLGPRVVLAEVEAMLRGNTDVHWQVSQALEKELVERQPWHGDGLRADGCLHQHNIRAGTTYHGYLDHDLGMLYTNNYGKELLKWTALLMTWYSNTRLDFNTNTVQGLYSAFLECHQWLFRGHVVEPTSIGRFITHGTRLTQGASKAGVYKVGKLLYKLGYHSAEIKSVLHRYNHPIPKPANALVGNKHFFCSDLMAHHRQEYMAALRMLSNRTSRPETWASGENRQGYFQGDGFLTLLVDAQEFGKPKAEVFQVYDWAKLPGVTNLYTKDIPTYQRNTRNAEHFFNNEKFVGGVSDGMVGMSAMVYSRPTVALSARKSWFFLGDIIVSIGTDITLPEYGVTNQSVVTTLAQVVYGGVDYTIGINMHEMVSISLGDHEHAESFMTQQPLWLHHNNVGYVFLGNNQLLHTKAKLHKTINKKNITVFSAWLDHGPSPLKASYAYVVLPAKTRQWTKDFASKQKVRILMQTTQVHSVCYDAAQIIGITFYSAESLLFTCGDSGVMEVSVNLPCLVLIKVKSYKADYAQIKVTIADPQQIYDIISVQVVWGNEQHVLNVNLPKDPNRGASVTHSLTFSKSNPHV